MAAKLRGRRSKMDSRTMAIANANPAAFRERAGRRSLYASAQSTSTATQAALTASIALSTATLSNGKTKVYYQPTQPSSPAEGDIWFNTTVTNGVALNYRPQQYISGTWTLVSTAALVIAADLAVGCVAADRIAANALATTDYDYTGTAGTNTEVATAGAKMQNTTGLTGAALLTCKDGMKVGKLTLEQMLVQMAISNWRPITLPNNTCTSVLQLPPPSGTLLVASTAGQVHRSQDMGNTWSSVGSNSAAQSMATNANGTQVVATASGTNAVVSYSGDYGATWATKAVASGAWKSVTWASAATTPAFVAVNDTASATSVIYSTDGQTWSTKTIPSGAWVDLAYSPSLNLFVAVQGNSSTYATSGDGGQTWTSRTFPSSRAPSRVTWNTKYGVFVAVEGSVQFSGGNVVKGSRYSLWSSDGLNWTVTNITSAQQAMSYVPGNLVSAGPAVVWAQAADGSYGDSTLAYSFDNGVTWKTVSTGIGTGIRNIEYVPSYITGGTGMGHLFGITSDGTTKAGMSLQFDPE